MTVKVSVCQVPDIREDIDVSLQWIQKFAKQAEDEGVSLMCFPECFLQGYLTEKVLAEKYAINLNGLAFKSILKQLAKKKPVIVFGLIEEEDGNLFNTAVVIKEGELLGKYRKTHLLQGEHIFKSGFEYPVFEVNGLIFGINICFDTQFAETAAKLAKQGVKLILCPANNMMKYGTAEKYKQLHNEMRIKRVKENHVWLMSADVTGKREGCIAYGPTSAINPDGKVVAQVSLMETGMVIVNI
jgi:predicted amidohydrolase